MAISGPISRRGFLKTGIAGASILAGAGVVLPLFMGDDDADYEAFTGDEIPEVLTIKQLAILTVFASRVIKPVTGSPTVLQARTAKRIDRELVFAGNKLVSDIQASIGLIEYGTVLDLNRYRFTSMSPAAQDDYLLACQHSNWSLRRAAFNGLRFLSVFFYYNDERTWGSIGYKGAWVAAKKFAAGNRLENLPPLKTAALISPGPPGRFT